MSYSLTDKESKRLETLHNLHILDTFDEVEFDDLTRLAAEICGVPISVISLLDADRHWFKSKVGLDFDEVPRGMSICSHTVLQNELFVVPNTCEDERFAEHPSVKGEMNVRFYAGVPLITNNDDVLGTLCVLDRVPRELRPEQKEALLALARQTMKLINLRQQANELAESNKELNREISERESIEKVLRLRDLAMMTVTEGILITENHPTENKIIYANAGFEKMTGYSFDEILGFDCRFLQGKETNPATVDIMRQAIKQKKSFSVEILNYRKDGITFWNALSVTPVKDDFGKVTHYVGVQKDMTARKEAEKRLQTSERQYRFLAESIPQQVWTARPDGYVDYGNERVNEYFDKELVNELQGENWLEILHPDDTEKTIKNWTRALKTGEVYENEFRLQRKDGEYRWHLAQAIPMHNTEGEIIKWFGTNTDIHERKLAEAAMRQSEEYRNLFKLANDAILLLDLETEVIVDANDKACEMYGFERQEFIGKNIKEISQDITRGEKHLRELSVNGTDQQFETVQFRADGTAISLLVNSSVIEYQSRKVVLSINRDITNRKKTEEELQKNFSLLMSTLEATADGILAVDSDDNIIAFNNKFAEMWNISEDILEYRKKTETPLNLVEKLKNPDEYLEKTEQLDDRDDENSFDVLELKNGKLYERYRNPQKIENKIVGQVYSFRDVTERKRIEDQLTHNALHDALTDLPNRALFLEHLRHTIKINERRFDAAYAVLFLDFDHFKVINDSLGHMEGDKLLVQIAKRLKLSLRSGDIVARIGGDEFTILLDDLEDMNEALRIAERILEDLNEPFNLSGREIFISASIGIASNKADYTKPEEILRDADIAMYRAKAGGRARLEVFNQTMHEQANTRLQMESEMRRAVKEKEFTVYYQPIVDLQNDRIIGFESLVRWIHPAHGIIPPDEFIPLAEETGLIIPLGEWILCESCRQLKTWQTANPENADLTISVNLSCKQFLQPDLVKCVAEILDETKLDAEYLRLEITESHLMEDSAAAISIMENLRALGIKISIDDFGTGYSSLSYLHSLPINYLKIDRSFVSRMQNGSENGEIVETIIALAKNLNIATVAEGIETPEQAEFLKNQHCDFGQGYLYSKPVAAEHAEKLLQNTLAVNETVMI